MTWLHYAAIAANIAVLALFIWELKGQLRETKDQSILFWDESEGEE